jgi:hypothetical protein
MARGSSGRWFRILVSRFTRCSYLPPTEEQGGGGHHLFSSMSLLLCAWPCAWCWGHRREQTMSLSNPIGRVYILCQVWGGNFCFFSETRSCYVVQAGLKQEPLL